MLTIEILSEQVERSIGSYSFPDTETSLFDPATYLLSSGGKRIRPLFCLLSASLFSESYDEAIPIALAHEIFHNSTLIHDDLMDQAEVRRGEPAVHIRYSPEKAILSGDAMMIHAAEIVLHDDVKNHRNLAPQFLNMCRLVCQGQDLDLSFEHRRRVSTEDYLEMIRLKTAELIASSLRLGALAVGASFDDAELLYRYGIDVGIVFQIIDDYLDLYTEDASFGKRIGGDLEEGKKTILPIVAYDHASVEDAKLLDKILSDRNMDLTEKVRSAKDIFHRYDVVEKIDIMLSSYVSESKDILSQVNAWEDRKQLLSDFVFSLSKRTH